MTRQFVERSSLSEGKKLPHRAHRDIHSQLPPPTLSVSLDIMHEGDQVPWRDQYIVDLRQETDNRGTSAKRPTLPSSKMLLRCAVRLTANGRDVGEQFAKAHAVPWVRANAVGALAAVERGRKGRRCWGGGWPIAMRAFLSIVPAGSHYSFPC